MHQSIAFYVYLQKNLLLSFCDFWFPRYCRFRRFLSKKYLSLTFALVNFGYHATCHWKALEEQISNMYTFMGENPFVSKIYCLIIFAFLPKKYKNSLSYEYYQKLFVAITLFCLHQSIPFDIYVKKNFLPRFFDFWFPRYCRFRRLFPKKYISLTFAVVNFGHHATCHWKALEEQISNMYTFMGENPFVSKIYCLIIFALLPKKYKNSLSYEYYQKLFVGITLFCLHQSIPFDIYVKKTFLPSFFHFWFPRYCRFRRFFPKKYILLTFAVVNFGHHATCHWKALEE